MIFKKKFIICMLVMMTANMVKSQNDSLKVMTYNIWNGFDWGKEVERKEKTIAWLSSQNIDVLALQELNDYTQEKLETDAKKWGHNYAVLLKEKGYSVGLTSKKPIDLIEKVRKGMWHGMLVCSTYGIDFYVVHLSPSDYAARKKEVAIIQSKISQRKGKEHIVLGDFNAHSPHDSDYLINNKQLLQKYLKGDRNPSNKYKNTVNEQFDFSVISHLLGIPLIDVTTKFVPNNKRFTFPAYAVYRGDIPKRSYLNFERLDYILTSQKLARDCTSSTIHNNNTTDELSDHYPVEATFLYSENN